MASLADYAHDERSARVLLSVVAAEAGAPMAASRLLSEVGGVETIRLLGSDGPMPSMRAVSADLLRQRVTAASERIDLDETMRDLLDGRHAVLIPGDAHWPASLDDLSIRGPMVLWARGATSLMAGSVHDRVTITGARASTDYGNLVAGELASELARGERVVVAGGAYGIEAAAHRAALAGQGHTIAILPGGIDRLYPRANQELLERVADYGLLLSEQPPGSVPTRDRFSARHRLLAAISSATVVVEAGARSGSLQVAREAQAIGRPVGAVPGPITSAASTGPNGLLREGIASVVATEHDLTRLMDRGRPAPQREPARRDGFTRDDPEPARDNTSRSLQLPLHSVRPCCLSMACSGCS